MAGNVTTEDIARIARLMRIELDDHELHAGRIEKMLEYFEILDEAGTDDADLEVRQAKLDSLREDEHLKFDGNLKEHLKCRDGYVRSPKLV